jgi:hypothetical protein
MMTIVRRCLIVAALVVLLLSCSSSSKKAPSASGAVSTATTQATTTTSKATTTTSIDSPNLQDHVIAPPPGYSYASSLGDSNNPNSPGGSSGSIADSEFNSAMGIPNAATTLHFVQGYEQWYHFDASPPNSPQRATDIILLEFDTATDASAFVQQAADRFVSQGSHASRAATTVSGAPALTIDDTRQEPDGTYGHAFVAARGKRAMQLIYLDSAAGPSSFLASIAPQQYVRL